MRTALYIFITLFALVLIYFWLEIHRIIVNIRANKPPRIPNNYSKIFKNPNGEEAVNLIVIGDSSAQGVGSDGPESTIGYLFAENYLQPRYAKVRYQNLGELGATTKDVIDDQLDQVIAQQPEMIILSVGANDVKNLIPRQIFEKNYKQIIERINKETKARLYVFNIPAVSSAPIFDSLLGKLIASFYKKKNKNRNNFIGEYLRSKNILMVDIYNKIISDYEGRDEYFARDSFHPSSLGYKGSYEELVRLIEKSDT